MKTDLQRLANLAYHRTDWGAKLVRRYYRARLSIPAPLAGSVEHLYQWFLAPMTLWPCNLHGFLEQILDTLENGQNPDAAAGLLLDILPPLPDPKTIEAVAAHEHDVQTGRYEHLVPASPAKFLPSERVLARNPEFRADWNMIAKNFDVASHADHKGVIRRTMVPERNLRTGFDLDWRKPGDRFSAVFDSFCAKWNLYGMENGEPLLQNLSVNLTPFGTMIFIPAYWSFDYRRDLRWGAVTKLHKSRGQHRQGVALAEGAEQRRRDAEKLVKLDAKAKTLRLRGPKRHEFLCQGLGWDLRTDPKRIFRLRKLSA